MPQKTVKCYGIKISTADVLFFASTGAMDEFLDGLDVVGVYMDQNGYDQLIVFRKKEQAKQALKKSKEMGFGSTEMYPTMIYVPEKDIKKKD